MIARAYRGSSRRDQTFQVCFVHQLVCFAVAPAEYAARQRFQPNGIFAERRALAGTGLRSVLRVPAFIWVRAGNLPVHLIQLCGQVHFAAIQPDRRGAPAVPFDLPQEKPDLLRLANEANPLDSFSRIELESTAHDWPFRLIH